MLRPPDYTMHKTIKVLLPLHHETHRCLGHWQTVGEWCPKIDTCARHMTMHDLYEPWAELQPPLWRACNSDEFNARIPLEGYEKEDA